MSSKDDARIVEATIAARDNIALIREWAGGLSLEALKADKKTHYAVERAFIAINTAVQDAPAEELSNHGIPANMIAGFRNVLAHTYDDILDDRVILTIQDDLPALDTALLNTLSAFRSA